MSMDNPKVVTLKPGMPGYERKELKSYTSDHIRSVTDNCDNDDPCFWEEFYIKSEADAVMDAQEARIKELESKHCESRAVFSTPARRTTNGSGESRVAFSTPTRRTTNA